MHSPMAGGSPIEILETYFQDESVELDGLSALSTTGLVVRTGVGSYTTRTLTGPVAGLSIANGSGVSGNPTISLADDLAGLEALSGTGMVVRTAANTYTNRTLTGTANEITVTNGDGVSGNPIVSLPSNITLTGKTLTGGAFTGGTWDNGVIGGSTAAAITGTTIVSTDTTDASSSITGALKTAGGLGVAKSAWIGTIVNIGGSTTTSGTGGTVSLKIGGTSASTQSVEQEQHGYATTDAAIGGIGFVNRALAVTEKRLAIIGVDRTGADNSGRINFYTMNAGTLASRAYIDKAGRLILHQAGIHALAIGYTGTETNPPTYSGKAVIYDSFVDGPEAIGGLEFVLADTASGYGAKLYTRNADGSFGIATRYNSATWTTKFSINTNTGNATFVNNVAAAELQSTILNTNAASDLLLKRNGTTGITLGASSLATFAGAISVTGHTTFEGVTSTGATGTGKLVYDGTPTLVTPNIGAATGSSLVLTGNITKQGGATLITTNTALTDGAGAGAGTITNAPAAGNPTKWIGINDNGTTRYVPAW